jgi:hypothetical protein
VSDLQTAAGTPVAEPRAATGRSLVVVIGSGRSGTSLVSGILQRLGCLVVQPEVPADASNPRGFAESQWVVDFHARLLRAVRVQTADARPDAWARTAQACLDTDVRETLRRWLEPHFAESSTILVKDPRLSWFLPLWRRVAHDLDATPLLLTMLRHPAAVVDSKQRNYGGRQGEANRLAGWVNQTLFTERGTRDSPRAFARYDDLLADWTKSVGAIGETLDLAVVRDASAAQIRAAHEFVDRDLARSRADWGELLVPGDLRDLAERVWARVDRLADDPAAGSAQDLDDLRAEYARYYGLAESVAYSSVAAAGDTPPKAAGRIPTPVLRLLRLLPPSIRQAIPANRRARMAHAMRRSTRQRA